MLSLAILFSLLLAAVHGPSVAHEGPTDHSAHEQAPTGDHDHASAPTSDDGDEHDDSMHHHCPNAWCPDAQAQKAMAPFGRVLILPDLQPALASLAQAPPTQPPSS